MKNIILLMALFSTSLSYSQSQNWWKSDGTNTGSNSTFVGTANNYPLRFKANGTEWFSISPTGTYTFNSLNSTTKGILGIDQNGILFRTDFTGNSNDVFTGTGDFVNMGTLTGWTLDGNTLFSNYNIGIGTNIVPEKLTVNGNILANGSISGTSLNVIDIVTSGKEFKISTSLCMKGIDANIPGSRNEICGLNGDLYIQSELNNNYNTVFGYNNGSKVGFGIIPIEKFHVGVNARFDETVYMNKILPLDSVFTIGDSTLNFSGYYNNIWGSTSGTVKGTGFGGNNTFGIGLSAVAIGKRIKASGNFSIAIGKTDAALPIFDNVVDNSLMVAFNSNIPTLFVGNSNGLNTFGKIGVGTSTPGDRFQVGNDYTSFTIGSADFSTLNYGTSYIGFNATRTGSGWEEKTDGAHNGASVILSGINGDLSFVAIPNSNNASSNQLLTDQNILDNTKLFISAFGNIGVGLTNPTNKLEVAGTVRACKFIAEANSWCDFVFAEGYHLMSIAEMEQYLKIEKHLKYLPSEKEIYEKGVDVVEVYTGLLRHTEENTLYIIQLEKENAELEKRIEELEKEKLENDEWKKSIELKIDLLKLK